MWKHRFKKDVNSFAVLRQKTTILIRSYELNEAEEDVKNCADRLCG